MSSTSINFKELISILENGTAVGSTDKINFVDGDNTNASVSLDLINNRIDVAFNSSLGFTAENVANKSNDAALGGATPSTTLYPTQNAVKTYADNILGNANALIYKGVIDCSTNPPYPAANAGELYIANGAGKIGGASGVDVELGDMIICNTDGTASGNQATVGNNWNIIEKNIVGAVSGPASSTNNNVAFFDGTTGKLIKDSGITLSGTNTGDETNSSIISKLGFTPEDVANKQSNLTASATKYPTVDAVNTGLNAKQNTVALTTSGTSGAATIGQDLKRDGLNLVRCI